MPRKPKVASETKIRSVEKILSGQATIKGTARELGLHPKSVQQWLVRYKAEGRAGLIHTGRNKHYPKEIKEAAVRAYLEGNASQLDICRAYGVSSSKVLMDWVGLYNAHKELRPTGRGYDAGNMKSRDTKYEERVEIVQYCLAHGNDYSGTAKKYGVSYQNVYSWVAKYKEMGNPGLEDRRGKRIGSLPGRTPEEELRARIAQLEAKNRMLQMENDLLKKVEELSRDGHSR